MKNKLQETVDEIEYNSKCLQTALLKENNHSFQNIFGNTGNKILGQAMYDVLKDIYLIGKNDWKLDRDDWINWLDEIEEELNE